MILCVFDESARQIIRKIAGPRPDSLGVSSAGVAELKFDDIIRGQLGLCRRLAPRKEQWRLQNQGTFAESRAQNT